MKKILLISACLILLILGCKKDKEQNSTPVQTNLSQFQTKYAAPSQFFTVAAGQSTDITGTQGTIIRVYSNSFYPIMTGDVKIELREFYSRKDILLGNLQTRRNDNGLLATAGMVYVKVTKNDSAVNDWLLRTKMPAQTTNYYMKIYISKQDPIDSSFVWTYAGDSSSIYLDTSNYYYGLIYSNNNFLWINCDFFIYQTPVTNVKATFTNLPQSSFTPEVYLVLDTNAITNMWYSPNQNEFVTTNIPEGLTGKIVAYTVVNGVYYFCKQPITVTTNLNQSMTFQIVTEQQLITELENL